MKKLLQYKRIYLLLLIPVSLLLILLAKSSVFFAEHIYALRIYKVISQIISLITGILPFSVAEVLILLLPIWMLFRLIKFVVRMVKEKGRRGILILKGTLNLSCMFSVLIFLFVLMGGINYYRYNFSQYSNLEIRDSSVVELYELSQYLSEQANELRQRIPQTDENGVFELSMSKRELAKASNQAYANLAKDYPVFKGHYGLAKPIMLSHAMSYTEITGIFIPFTMEANVNIDVPSYSIPATMLHEIAHQRGFMREDEANFIAYLAGMKSDRVELQYSSTMLALVNVMNALYDKDPTLYFDVRNGYSDAVLADSRANSAYWAQFKDNVVSTVSNKVNDTYLKVNNQTDGVHSYGRMVDLMLANYREKNNETVR